MNASKALRRMTVTAVIAGMSAGMLAIGWDGVSVAHPSPPTYTLSGEGGNGSPFSPDSNTINANVHATLTGKLAGGTLETNGRPTGGPEGTVYVFNGTVTCMKIKSKGKRVVVGAFGTVTEEPKGDPPLGHQLPGKYAQLLTVEFGSFTNPEEPKGPPLTFSFGVLGAREEGVTSTKPPRCNRGKFDHQILPTSKGPITLTV